MNKSFGSQSMVAPLKWVMLRRPDEAFAITDPQKWHYTAPPDLGLAQQEHDTLVDMLREADVEIVYHDIPLPEYADAIFVHDPVLVCDKGAIILKMGKDLRQGEEDAMAAALEKLDIPIHYRLHGEACAEGGDLLWIDEKTLAVGQGFRTNGEGLRQLAEALPDVEIVPVQLPYYQGPDACLHLMSFISIIDYDLAVIYPPLMPVPLWQLLEKRGFRFVEVPEAEFLTMGPNVLALAPRLCLMLVGNPITQQRLAEAGCTVLTYQGDEISLKAEGGATCLTRPLLRQEEKYPLVNAHLEGDSFFWEGGPVGVLLLHGLTATTAEVRPLARLLHEKGYTVAGPLLPGHGTTPADLNRATWRDWVWEAEQSYQHLATVCDQVFVGGESTGAVVALYLASKYEEISGILAYSPAIQLALPPAKIAQLYLSAPFIEAVPKQHPRRNPFWQGYPVTPLRGARELLRLDREVRGRLTAVNQPIFVVQGRHDETIDPDSGQIICDGVSSDITELHWMEESSHVVILDGELAEIATLTGEFIKES